MELLKISKAVQLFMPLILTRGDPETAEELANALKEIEQKVDLEVMKNGKFRPQITHFSLMPFLTRFVYFARFSSDFNVDLSRFKNLV